MTLDEVEGDRVGAGVETFVRKELAQLNDLVFETCGGALWAPPWSSRPRLEPRLTFGIEPADELMDPLPRHPVVPSDLAFGAPFHPHRRDDEPSQ